MKKKKQKTEQQQVEALRKRCVAKAKKISKRLAKGICAYCGATNRVCHSHHIFSEGLHKGMSADVDNFINLCWLHHLGGLKFVSTKVFSFHGHPTDATIWLEENLPERYQRLKIRSREVFHLGMAYWSKKMEELVELENKLDSANENEINQILYDEHKTGNLGDDAIENEVNRIMEEIV